jgi:hypothetical protein
VLRLMMCGHGEHDSVEVHVPSHAERALQIHLDSFHAGVTEKKRSTQPWTIDRSGTGRFVLLNAYCDVHIGVRTLNCDALP